ncbi:MAG: hypothetical protein OQK12_17370 [Motiliproteus sp.]|nr:hypothetical protein [Motiliproteus sp.]MCW9054195.1 hypothetical protein [Motiliproteus sp.]
MKTMHCERIDEDTLSDWTQPSERVGSGQDDRSSQNGLLSIFYGSLDKASQYNWLNAGRTLVDKTYINILKQSEDLPSIGVDSHHVATELDRFIREELQPIWQEIDHLDHTGKQALTLTLLDKAADRLFGSDRQENHASWLLFYLCPQLPIFPYGPLLNQALSNRLHQESVFENYHPYYRGSCELFTRMLPNLVSEQPPAWYGDKSQQQSVNRLKSGSDWWQRHRFIRQLEKSVD